LLSISVLACKAMPWTCWRVWKFDSLPIAVARR